MINYDKKGYKHHPLIPYSTDYVELKLIQTTTNNEISLFQ